ncbi:unnamed protein product [Fraxinus pennsylvanica]|uniref:Glycosyl transferase CAP10 domain-containing protein n=1 Tax=Fraxinus pennsylvanica TaxID=56036 RepID=A0AAD1ZBH6_9LAMI|nr:unnamed protein product [Fraxinus pennsylvanica]
MVSESHEIVLKLHEMEERPAKRGVQTSVTFLLVILVAIATILRWINVSSLAGSFQKRILLLGTSQKYSSEFDCSLKCSDISPLTNIITDNNAPSESCPEYFKWIHEDLRPWKVTGITKEMVEKAIEKADFNIVIVNGSVYIKKFKEAFQTRDTVTIWGILQLLRLYPGKLPDMDFMFACGDKPVIEKCDYGQSNASYPPPPMFHYCGDDSSFDIVFPDWSFWGWPELNIKPWETLKEDLQEGNSRIKWSEREPYAYWKGNAKVSPGRHDLLKCNGSEWNTRIDKVAQEIGKTGSKYIQEQLRMKYIYDYMFHLLNEYSKLLKYKPAVPKGAVEVCSETMVCSVEGLKKKLRIDSMVKGPADSSPCTLPSSHYRAELEDFLEMKDNLTKQVKMLEEGESLGNATMKTQGSA